VKFLLGDVYFALVYLRKRKGKIDYQNDVLTRLSRDVLIEIVRIVIREKMKLICWGDYIAQHFINKVYGLGFKFSCPYENIDKVLEMLLDIFTKQKGDFLNTTYGKKWFKSQISDYVLHGNINYDCKYSERMGMNILHDYEYKY